MDFRFPGHEQRRTISGTNFQSRDTDGIPAAPVRLIQSNPKRLGDLNLKLQDAGIHCRRTILFEATDLERLKVELHAIPRSQLLRNAVLKYGAGNLNSASIYRQTQKHHCRQQNGGYAIKQDADDI